MSDGIAPSLDELIALRRAAGGRRPPRRGRYGLSGQAPSPQRGRGMEYAESREYARGDDARHIDWRLTARTGRPHTKVFQAERERLTLIVADTAASLYFGTRTRFKSVQAARAGALAAWVAVRDGDRIAALRGSTHEAPVLPTGGTRGALRALDALVRWYAHPPEDDAGLAVALDHADRLLRPGSRMVLLADAHSVLSVPASRWPALVQHREVVALLPCDPLERDPPRARLPFRVGPGVASDPVADRAANASASPAGIAQVELDLTGALQRGRWRDIVAAPQDAALAVLGRGGVRAQLLPTDASADTWLPLLAGARGA